MPSAARPERIVRLWTLVLLLIRARTGLTQTKLTEELKVSRMTLHRDLVALEAAGLPIERRQVNGELRLALRSTDLPLLVLDPDQVQALTVARRLLDPLVGTRVLRAYDDVLVRLGRKPGPSADSPHNQAQLDIRETVETAMETRRGLRMLYVKERESKLEVRTIEPLGWRFVRGTLSLFAYDALRDATRSFQANRIVEAHVLDAPVRKNAADGDNAAYFSEATELETLPFLDVVVRLAPEAWAHLHENPLSPKQVATPDGHGGGHVRASVAGIIWPFRWTLSWGRFAVAEGPPELREMLASEFKALARAYEAQSNG